MKRFPLTTASFACLAGLALGSPSQGQEQVAPQTEELGRIIALDVEQRMTVPVNIGASGPHRFVIDTGSERTVISQELARKLGLDPGRTTTMHSMTEVSQVGTVVIPRLQVGGKSLTDINAPALDGRNLGAEGLLGVDTLQSQRVLFDFKKQRMTVTASRRRDTSWPSDTIVITARSKFGQLILVDASVDGQKVWVVIDTGSEATVANNALRRKLEKKGRLGPTIKVALTSVTGTVSVADQGIAKKIQIGGINVKNMPLVFMDAHPFRKLDLIDRPAILLGMDALQLFERVSVDFANRTVKILPGGQSALPTATRVARMERSRPVS